MKENVALPSPPLPLSPETDAAAPRRRAVRWPLYLGGAAVILGVVGFGAAGGAYSTWHHSDAIAPGVSVAGIEVGGLSRDDAKSELQTRFGRLFMKLQTAERPFRVSLLELGGAPSIDTTVERAYEVGRDGNAIANFLRVYGSKTSGQHFMLPMLWNKRTLVTKLYTINHIYASSPTDARLHVGENGVEIIPDKAGHALNIGETAKQIQSHYFIGKPELDAATREVQPKVAAADLVGQDIEIAHYRTAFNSGLAGRTTNIRTACATINGHVLMPGESFSFNEMTGERTFAKGYRMAHIFERKPGETESEVVDGLAGGVCQVSSTLFNAVRRTNANVGSKRLQILERNTHSLPVTYVPKGLDATVAWPGKDFRFRNNFDHPVYIRTTINRSRLTIGIWGRVSDEQATEITTIDEAAKDAKTDD